MKYFILISVFVFPILLQAQYTGTASVTQGAATTTTTNLYTCTGGRIAGLGTITATDNTVWTVPAAVNYTNTSFPFASDLYNPCTGATYANATAALAVLNGSDIVNIDPNGELITAYIFADNYFEMYINGVPVGKDNVPYTQFNSNIVRFRVNRPFTIAMLLVDWEEHLGLGSEVSGPTQYHDGDGGMVAVFKDASNNTIAITGSDWKAQTFYTGPITDLTCPTENGTARLSSTCSTADNNNGSNYYGLHWARPASWTSASFNDTSWPNATTYTNATIGVNNKPAYTNFTNIFDDPAHDAQFIWSSNVILDNEVIVRYTVPAVNGVQDNKPGNSNIQIYPNPASNVLHITMQDVTKQSSISDISLYNSFGQKLMTHAGYTELLDLTNLPTGLYIVTIMTDGSLSTYKFIKE